MNSRGTKKDKKPKTDKPSKPKGNKPRRRQVPPEVSSARKYAAYQMRIMNPRMTYAAITTELNQIFPDYPLKSEHQAVEKMVKEAEKEYIDEHKAHVEEIKAESGAVMDWVRAEAAEAWVKTKNQIAKTEGHDDDGDVAVFLTAGNAQYLRRITEATEVKAKIFGAQAPKKHEVTGKNGAPLVPPVVDMKLLGKYLSNDDLSVLQQAAEIIERAQRDLAAAVTQGD